jgi:hypothetical protein
MFPQKIVSKRGSPTADDKGVTSCLFLPSLFNIFYSKVFCAARKLNYSTNTSPCCYSGFKIDFTLAAFSHSSWLRAHLLGIFLEYCPKINFYCFFPRLLFIRPNFASLFWDRLNKRLWFVLSLWLHFASVLFSLFSYAALWFCAFFLRNFFYRYLAPHCFVAVIMFSVSLFFLFFLFCLYVNFFPSIGSSNPSSSFFVKLILF